MTNEHYIIAVKREARQSVPPDWVEELTTIPGITLLGATGGRAQIEATAPAIQELRRRRGQLFSIEPAVMHRPLAAS